jgi:hypothetical protein
MSTSKSSKTKDGSAISLVNNLVDMWAAAPSVPKVQFGGEIMKRLKHVDASVLPLEEAPKQAQAKLVTELEVTEGELIIHR